MLSIPLSRLRKLNCGPFILDCAIHRIRHRSRRPDAALYRRLVGRLRADLVDLVGKRRVG